MNVHAIRLFFAATLIGTALPSYAAEPPSTAKPADSSLERWADQLRDPEVRRRAAALRELRDREALPTVQLTDQLIDLLDDTTQVVLRDAEGNNPEPTSPSILAADVLKRLGDQALQGLAVALAEGRPSIRWRAAMTLGQTGSPEAIPHLLAAIEQDRTRLVQLTASEALVAIGKVNTQRLIELFHGENETAREQAIWVLGEIRETGVIDDLLDYALNASTRNAPRAVEALYKMGDPAVRAVSLKLTHSSNPQHKVRLMQIAAQMRDPRILEYMMFTLLTEVDTQIRKLALLATDLNRNPVATDVLLNVLTDPDKEVAELAAPSLRGTADVSARIIYKYTRTPDPIVQEYAINALGVLGPSAIPQLVQIISDEHIPHHIKRKAAGLLQRQNYKGLAAPDRVKCLVLLGEWQSLALSKTGMEDFALSLLDHEESSVRAGGIYLLSRRANDRVIPRIISRLGAQNLAERNAAIEAIEYIGDPAIPHLIKALSQNANDGQATMVELLDRLDFTPETDIERLLIYTVRKQWEKIDAIGDIALSYVLEALQDRDPHTTVWAAWLLSRYSLDYSLTRYEIPEFEHVLSLLIESDDRIRMQSTYRSLARIGNYRSVAYLLVPLFGEDKDRKELALESIGKIGYNTLDIADACLLSGEPTIRKLGLDILQEIGAQAVPILTRYLNDPDLGPRCVTLLEAQQFRPRSNEERIAMLLASGEYQQVARMGKIGLPYLLDAARNPSHPEREAVLLALGKSGDFEVVTTLLWAMAQPQLPIREAAFTAIESLGEGVQTSLVRTSETGSLMEATMAANALLRLKYEPKDEQERLWLIAARRDWEEIDESSDAVRDMLRSEIMDVDDNRRAIATASLAAYREYLIVQRQRLPDTVNAEVIESLSHPNAELRAFAIDIIRRHGSHMTELIPVLLEMLDDNTPVFRVGNRKVDHVGEVTPGTLAALALGEMQEAAIDPLLDAYNDAERLDRSTCLLAISGIADARLIAPLKVALKSEKLPAVRERAARSLALIDEGEYTALLVNEAIASEDRRFREIVRTALVSAGTERLDRYIELIDAIELPDDKAWMIEVVGDLLNKNHAPLLLSFADHEHPRIRKAAYRALSRTGSKIAIDKLIEALSDSSWAMREVAADALIDIGYPTIDSLVEQFVPGKKSENRYIAKVLRLISGKDFGEQPDVWKNWWAAERNNLSAVR